MPLPRGLGRCHRTLVHHHAPQLQRLEHLPIGFVLAIVLVKHELSGRSERQPHLLERACSAVLHMREANEIGLWLWLVLWLRLWLVLRLQLRLRLLMRLLMRLRIRLRLLLLLLLRLRLRLD